MKKILILNVILVFLLYSCDEIDNYAAPDKILDGTIVDKVTGENLYTRQPDGIKIRLIQDGYSSPIPIDFWAKSDGSFRNARLFAGAYSVIPMEGAFESSSVTAQAVNLNQNSTLKFSVEPYLRLKNVSITASAPGTIKATYNIELTTSTKDPNKCFLMVHTSVFLHEATTGLKKSADNNLLSMDHSVITSTNFVDQITGLTPGTYYARVGALATNSLNRYNYSPIIKVIAQ